MKLKRPKFKRKQEEIPESRLVAINHVVPSGADESLQQNFTYPDNKIQTSKYTILNFLPKNLYGQFRRIANFYFLCLCIIHFSINSPVSPITSLLPLLFVVTVTGLKQGYEDWKRHREDNKVNSKPTAILTEQQFQDAIWSDIKTGDIVKVEDDQEFPSDILLLSSSRPNATCDVTTANLDGETNLKTFEVPTSLQFLKTEQDLSDFHGIIECQQPHANLYDFRGRLDCSAGTISLNTNHLLLRGARLKNTDYIYGCTVYAGSQTKLALNSKMTSIKFSTIEKTLNKYLLFYLGVMIFLVFICTLLKYQVYDLSVLADMWYLGDIDVSGGASFGIIMEDAFSFFILLSYLIPISLYVTLEMQKFMGTYFFVWDEEMRCPETGEAAVCNTSDLNEELGQVQYLFTDKTGTLTENIMNFRQCSVGGVKFFDGSTSLKSIDGESIEPRPQDIINQIESFLLTLALCHTVKVKSTFETEDIESEEGVELQEPRRSYMASSPDEKALVEACEKYGVIYEGESDNTCRVTMQGQLRRFKRLETLEFDSDRKLMSVIVANEKDEIWLLTKGAEVSVLRRCAITHADDQELREMTLKHIDDYAMLGLRTLAVGRKRLGNDEYSELSRKLMDARNMVHGRDEAVREVFDEIESDLTLQGATGVEDMLQEGVQETLESLSLAGVKVWVLTGDKVETAVNIGFLCGLFKRFMSLLYLTHLDTESSVNSKLEESLQELQTDSKHFGLVVDGLSLLLLLKDFPDEFYDVCCQCSAVICCRMSPKQKAEIVKLVKTCGGDGVVCAAIGDGANDVSMIQEAHIGLGIMGKEGRQAVRCADFAFGKFRFVKKALLVHGHWFYDRISKLVHYCFYKNVAFIMAQFLYTFACAYSTESVYEGAALTMFNITYTGLPIIIVGLFDQVYPQEVLMNRPHLYQTITGNRNMRWQIFITWGLLGFWHSAVCYYVLHAATVDDTADISGPKTQDLFLFGIALTTVVVWLCNLKVMIETKHYNVVFFASIVITLVGYDLFYLVYSGCFPKMGIFWTFYIMHTSWAYMFSFALIMVIAVLPDILIKVYLNRNLINDKKSKLLSYIDRGLERYRCL